MVAIDGTKVLANASRDANLDYEQIAREILEEAQAVDAAEDEAYGEARGDELPPELTSSQGRRKWLREAQRELDEQRERAGPAGPALTAGAAEGGQAPPRRGAVDRVPGQRGL